MKLSFSTLPCMDLDAEELRELCKKYHIDGVELRQKNHGTITVPSNVYVTNIGSNICLKGYDGNQLIDAKKVFDLAFNYDIKAVRIFLGNFCQRYDIPKAELDHDGIVKAIRELCDYSGVEVWVETHNEFATGKILKSLIDDVDRKNLKIIWDIIHPIEDGEDYRETWDYIGEYIAHIHIKDGKERGDPIWHDYLYTKLGAGDIPIKEIIELCLNNGFDGYFSLEWENVWRKELKQYPSDINFILSHFLEAVK